MYIKHLSRQRDRLNENAWFTRISVQILLIGCNRLKNISNSGKVDKANAPYILLVRKAFKATQHFAIVGTTIS